MSKSSLIDFESQRIKKTVLSTTMAEVYSFMKFFGSCHSSADYGWTYRECERKLVHGVFMILLTFQLRIVWQIV